MHSIYSVALLVTTKIAVSIRKVLSQYPEGPSAVSGRSLVSIRKVLSQYPEGP